MESIYARPFYNRERVTCEDGFSVSIQDSSHHYCTPLVTAELGFPSEPMGDEFTPYAENREDLTETVYGHVPLRMVLDLIERHGGIASGGKVIKR